MFWENTNIFKAVLSFLQSVWAEPTGKIFLVTVIAYSFSYIIFSGYLAWFTGGIGSIPLSQAGYSVIDFFGLIPTVYLLIFQLAWKLLKFVFRMIVIYALVPLIFLGIGGLITTNFEIPLFANSFFISSLITSIGTILWVAGFFWGFSTYMNKGDIPRWSWIISIFGAFIAGLISPYVANQVSTTGATTTTVAESNIFLEVGAIFVLLFVFVLPYFMGLYLAQLSVNERVLSKIKRIIFTSPLEISGTVREATKKTPKAKAFDSQIFAYKAKTDQPVYLISMFSRNTALFLPQETTGEARGKLVMISNNEIRLMEIVSGVAGKSEFAKYKDGK
jgi:hypothetical protein